MLLDEDVQRLEELDQLLDELYQPDDELGHNEELLDQKNVDDDDMRAALEGNHRRDH